MKKLFVCAALGLLLCGCAPQEAAETVEDVYQPVLEQEAQQVLLQVPDQAGDPILTNEQGDTLYLWEDYTLTVATRKSGDVTGVIQETTGFTPDQLQVVETARMEGTQYDCIWTAAGEGGSQVGRLRMIDDGHHLYVMTIMAPEAEAAALQSDTWVEVLNSFRVIEPESMVSSGS